MFKPTSPENAAIIGKLEGVLSALSVGATVNYGELNRTSGVDVRDKRYLLKTAIERVEKNLGCAFETVRTLGVKRLSTEDAPDIGLAAVRRCRITARRGKKRLARLNSNSMSNTERSRVIGYGAMLGAIELLADGRKATAVAAVADPIRPIPPQNILEMFRQKA